MNSEIILFIFKIAGIGLLTGFIVGFISKKVSKIVIFFLVIGFILFQVVINNGYFVIDWLSWKDSTIEVVKQVDFSTTPLKEIIFRNAPFSISAIIGFIFGFKKG